MEILFKNQTTLSPENYLSFERFHQKKNNLKYHGYTATFSMLFILSICFQISANNYFVAMLLFLCFASFVSYRFLSPYSKTKKELSSDKVQNHLINSYFFYENFFCVKNSFGNSKLTYGKLSKVYENDNYFYLYLDKNYCFIVEKSGFMIGTEKDFKIFLKNKLGFKFKMS